MEDEFQESKTEARLVGKKAEGREELGEGLECQIKELIYSTTLC